MSDKIENYRKNTPGGAQINKKGCSDLCFEVKSHLDFSDEELTKCFFAMCDERRERVKRFKNEIQKRCTLAGEWMVRGFLSQKLGRALEDFEILPDQKGKLHLLEDSSPYFNISHSQDLVAAVVSDKRVGIDIEKKRCLSLDIAKKVCTPGELLYVFGKEADFSDKTSKPDADTIGRFLEIWTTKEAYFKCIGTGITDFQKVDALDGDFEKYEISQKDYVAHIVIIP